MTPVTRTIGRPRAFDADAALERAMLAFWARGYDGTSLSDLTEAMGISRKSLYAAFGNKEELFRKALQRYVEGPASYAARAISEPTARQVAKTFLAGTVQATTGVGRPTGCLTVQGSLAAGESGLPARNSLTLCREQTWSRLRDRFQDAADSGDSISDLDPGLLARYLLTVSNGIAVQAASGVSSNELAQVAEAALRWWPD